MPRPSTQATIKGRFKSEGAMGEGVMKRFTPTLRGRCEKIGGRAQKVLDIAI